MKGKNLIVTALIALAAGILMVIYRTTLASGTLITWGGILFIVAGLLNVTFFLSSRDREGKARMTALGTTFGWIASAAAVVLGLSMVIFHDAFTALMGFMFGVLLLFCALFQLVFLLFGARPKGLPGAFYIVPVLIICGAIYIFTLKSGFDERSIMTITGICLAVFGAGTIGECIALSARQKEVKAPENEPEERPTE